MHSHTDSAGRCGSTRIVMSAAIALSAALVLTAAARAFESDPVRNMHPEEPAGPDDVQRPLYFVLPVGEANDVITVAPEALLMDFMDKHTAMNYPAAVEAAMRLVAAVPDRSVGYYNLACAQARMRRTDDALEALRQAVAHGWRDDVHMSIDPDLSTLRSDARYAEIVNELKTARERERIMPTPLRESDWRMTAKDLTHQIPDLLARYHVPGAAVALIQDGRVVWTAAFGRRDMRSSDLLGVDDRFRLRAPLHMLAIAACEQMQQERKIELASLIVEAANERGLIAVVETGGTALGARPAHLRQSPSNGDRGSRSQPEGVASIRGPTRSYVRDSVYGFLRLAAEEAAESSFPSLCQQSLFPQFDMRQSAFGMPDETSTHAAVGHSNLGTPLRPSIVVGEFAPGGCIHMTAGDVARLIAGALVPTDATALAPDAQAHVFEPTLTGGAFGNAVDMVTQADAALAGTLGLALQRIETADGVRMQLDESASGIVCLARWYPATRSGIVVLCNAATGRDAAERIAHLALGGE